MQKKGLMELSSINFISFNFKNLQFLNFLRKFKQSTTPLLILQTDVDGLMKLKKSKAKNIKSRDNFSSRSSFSSITDEKNADSQCTLLFESSERIYTPKKKWSINSFGGVSSTKISKEKKECVNKKEYANDDSNVSFDICEISEQITSV